VIGQTQAAASSAAPECAADVSLGVSEPKEHEARMLMLDTLIRELRAGLLPLQVRRYQV
jgi:hypothetical protein